MSAIKPGAIRARVTSAVESAVLKGRRSQQPMRREMFTPNTEFFYRSIKDRSLRTAKKKNNIFSRVLCNATSKVTLTDQHSMNMESCSAVLFDGAGNHILLYFITFCITLS